jgi:hypothetical protein
MQHNRGKTATTSIAGAAFLKMKNTNEGSRSWDPEDGNAGGYFRRTEEGE